MLSGRRRSYSTSSSRRSFKVPITQVRLVTHHWRNLVCTPRINPACKVHASRARAQARRKIGKIQIFGSKMLKSARCPCAHLAPTLRPLVHILFLACSWPPPPPPHSDEWGRFAAKILLFQQQNTSNKTNCNRTKLRRISPHSLLSRIFDISHRLQFSYWS